MAEELIYINLSYIKNAKFGFNQEDNKLVTCENTSPFQISIPNISEVYVRDLSEGESR